MAPGDMFFIEHLNELRIRFFRIVVFAIAIVIFTSVFGIQLITINNFSFYFIYPSIYNNISSQTILFLSHSLLPPGSKINSDCSRTIIVCTSICIVFIKYCMHYSINC